MIFENRHFGKDTKIIKIKKETKRSIEERVSGSRELGALRHKQDRAIKKKMTLVPSTV